MGGIYKYDSWGKNVSITGALAATVGQKNQFRYRGYYFDAESGMYYLQSRYYDPEIKRFISADNIIITGTPVENQNVNLYEYCLDNPVNFQDQSGHFAVTIGAGYLLGALVIAGVAGASYLLARKREAVGTVDEFAWYKKSQKEKRLEAVLAREVTEEVLKQKYYYWTADLIKVGDKTVMVGGVPLTVKEACFRVAQSKSVICRNEAAARHIIFVNGYAHPVGPEKHGNKGYSHYHPTHNHTGYSSVHIWFFD